MNRSLMLGLVFGLATAWAGPSALAQKNPGQGGGGGAAKDDKGDRGKKGEKGEKGDRKQKDRGGDATPEKSIGEALADELNLTDKQVAEMKKIFAEHVEKRRADERDQVKKSNDETKKEIEAVQAEVREARKSKDEKKLKEAMQKMKGLRRESQESGAVVDPQFLEDLSKVMTDKQKDKYWEIVARYAGGETGEAVLTKYRQAIDGLGVSADQKKTIDKIFKKFEEEGASSKEKGRETSKELISKMRDEINTVLNEDQQSAFRKALKVSGKGEGASEGQGAEKRPRGAEGKGGKGQGAGAGQGKGGRGAGGQGDPKRG